MKRSTIAYRTLLALAALGTCWLPASVWAQAGAGETNFNTVCIACHTIGGGKRVGPDLKGVTERRSEDWLLRFIKNPQQMIDGGDATAKALFEEYNKVIMPPPPFSEAEIKGIVAYIASKSGDAPAAAAAPPPPHEATAEEIDRGRQIFEGRIRLANGGAPCNSCHHVKNDAVIGGGVLARELTQAFGRIGAPGIEAILDGPPFPVMAAAYKDKPLTTDEVTALVGFLQDADKRHELQQPRDFGIRLLASGATGLLPLFGLFALVGLRVKRRPVNYAVFERQIRSQGSGE